MQTSNTTYQKSANNKRKKYPQARFPAQVVVLFPFGYVTVSHSPSLSYTPTNDVIHKMEYPNEKMVIKYATNTTPAFFFTGVNPVFKLAAANGIRLQTAHA